VSVPELTAESLAEKAISLGSSLAGITDAGPLRAAPSYRTWVGDPLPDDVPSVVVLGLAHPESRPELDWWGVRGGTAGNLRLQQISVELVLWLERQHGIRAVPVPYHVERGGTFLKDAAVLAGLGVIGRNNLLITPCHGPRVRLRALFVDSALPAAAYSRRSPCDGCYEPCRSACPMNAFASGFFSREACSRQMEADESRRNSGDGVEDDSLIRYCRACELACPMGADLCCP
jgi:epoxyqueuosine reductase